MCFWSGLWIWGLSSIRRGRSHSGSFRRKTCHFEYADGFGKVSGGCRPAFLQFRARKAQLFYTSPIKALVNEKFFSLCETMGAQNVGLMTGDATVNRSAPIICCTAEILSALALSEGPDAEVHSAVMDEFHYYGDRDRGMAWQIPSPAPTSNRISTHVGHPWRPKLFWTTASRKIRSSRRYRPL